MSKGPVITKDVDLLIAEVYLTDTNQRAKEVQDKVNILLQGKGPGLSAIQKKLTKLRNSEAKERLNPLDKPWCIGTVSQFDIAPEALPVVLKIWKMSLLLEIEQPFIIRQAMWMARIYKFFPSRDIVTLYNYATLYARREHACELLGIPYDTADFDHELAMSKWEITTADNTGKRLIRLPVSKSPVEATPIVDGMPDGTIGESLQFTLLDGFDGFKAPPISLSEEEEWIYVIWLKYLSKGPKWISLPDAERRAIMVQLQEWVKKDLQTRDTNESYSILTKPEHIIDNELLRKVGYDVP